MSRTKPWCWVFAAWLLSGMIPARPQNSPFPPEQVARIQRGVRDLYSMEYERAAETFEAMIREAPDDPMGYAYLARTYWIQELAGTQELSIDRFAASDFFEEQPKFRPKVDPAMEDRFRKINDQAIERAKVRLEKNSHDRAALFLRGLAYQNLSSFETSLKRSWRKAMGSGRNAANDHARLLRIDPSFHDAKLSLGAKDNVLGSLPLGWKLILGVIGYSGDRERGRQTLEFVAKNATLVADDARILLILIHTRQKEYQKAYDYLAELQQKYPQNYLVRLDMGGMELLMNRPERAIAIYGEILRRRNTGERNYAGLELAFLYNRLGVAFRQARDLDGAAGWFRKALDENGRSSRSTTVAQLELGKTFDLMDRRADALKQYGAVIAEEDVAGSRLEAQSFLKRPYRSGE
jgi:tetratricopeptide (TPR) repeat protein